MSMLKSGPTEVTFAQAAKFCRESRLAGYTDWRLPTSTELRSIHQPLNKGNHNVVGAIRFSCLNRWAYGMTMPQIQSSVRTVFFGQRHRRSPDRDKY